MIFSEGKMNKLTRATVVGALMFTAGIPNTAFAIPVLPPAPPPIAAGTSGAAGAAATGGFIGFVALLDLYDIIRRTSCSGDFLYLGGPGFTTPITPGMNILPPPKCVPIPAHRHRKK
jgi:hypothetical protein